MWECHFKYYRDVYCDLASSRWCLAGLDVDPDLPIQFNFDSESQKDC